MREIAGRGHMSMWKEAAHPDFAWTGILLGVPILGVWYWCTDQFIVQRVLSAQDIDHARGGAIFGGLLKVLPLFLFVIPGVVAHGLAQQGRLVLEQPDRALPTLVVALLPVGFRGLVLAGLLAALTILHFAVVLFVLCSAVLVGVSLLTPAPADDRVRGLTFGGEPAAVEPRSPHFALSVALSGLLLATVAAVWLQFR